MTKYYIIILLALSVPFQASAQCDPAPIFANDSTHAVCFEEVNHVRKCYTNNIPDHAYGPFGGGNTLEGQEFEYSMCLYPEAGAMVTPLSADPTFQGCGGGVIFGVSMQGVNYSPFARLYWVNPVTQQENTAFEIEADFTLNMDLNGGHVNSIHRYHYHNIPQDYFYNDLNIDGTSHSPLVGYAADGFPIYYKYLYTDSLNLNGGISIFESSYQLKTGIRPGNDTTAPGGSYDGTYIQDYEYIPSLSVLDECGGRFGKTPEYPDGTYYYVLTDNWPYIPRCLKGKYVDNSFRIGPNCPGSSAGMDCSMTPILGVELLDANIALEIFPNPTSSILQIRIADELRHKISHIRLFTLDGRVVYQSNQLEGTIWVEHLSKGTYFIQIDWGQDQVTKKIKIE